MNKVDFIEWANQELHKARIRRTELAKIGGIDHGYVSHVLNRQQPPGDSFCRALAKALGLSAETVLYKAGLTDEKPPDYDQPGLRQVIEVARQLSPEKREHLAELGKMLKSGAIVINVPPAAPANGRKLKVNVEAESHDL
jgi:transcriptional regulator with XRE-family HTH domain